ncbi:S-layer family protein [Limnohabitans sp. G3-2]|uniref:beta strand repeat-containing protein n=1 Tax=Limnohabitans sp. G3-2 TaxID=1100711 RepID=UPI0013040090|nr:autotransporter-associated beta strand repeat-containing protein [Limnohabitans sp. G3-2]
MKRLHSLAPWALGFLFAMGVTGSALGGSFWGGTTGTWNASNKNWANSNGGAVNDTWTDNGPAYFPGNANITVTTGSGFTPNVTLIHSYNNYLNLAGTVRLVGNPTRTSNNANCNFHTSFAGSVITSTDLTINSGNLLFAGTSPDFQPPNITIDGCEFRMVDSALLSGGTLSSNFTSTEGGRIDIATSANQTFTGVISGNIRLSKRSTGTLTLSAANTYTGTTTVSGGTLAIDGSGSLGSGTYSNTITNNASLAFASAAAQTLSGVISGTGSLSKSASGTLTLTAANTYTGTTTVSGGRLNINGNQSSASGAVTVQSGGTLGGTGTVGGATTVQSGGTLSSGMSPGMSPGTFTFSGNLTLQSGSTTRFELAQAGTDGGSCNNWVPVGGNLELAGTLVVTATSGAAGCSSTFGEGSYTLFTYTGTATGSFSSITLPAGFAGQVRIDTNLKRVVLVVVPGSTLRFWDETTNTSANANNNTVNGGTGTWDASSNNWTDSAGAFNGPWAGTTATAVLGGTAGTVTLANGYNAPVGGITFDTTGYTLASTGSGTLALQQNATLSTPASVVNATISAPITGNFGLNWSPGAEGTLTLSAANTYTGFTTVSGGTLEMSGSGSTLASGAIFVGDSGILRLSRNNIWGSAGSAGHSHLSVNGRLETNNSYNTFTNPTFSDQSYVWLGGGNSVEGAALGLKGTVTTSGTVLMEAASGSTHSVILIGSGSGGSTTFDVSGQLSLGVPLANNGGTTSGPIKTGSGNLSLNADNAFTGNIAINAGSIRVNGSLGPVDTSVSTRGHNYAGNITNNGKLTFSNKLTKDYQMLSGVISGTGSLVKEDSGTLALYANNTYTGTTTIKGGAVRVRGDMSLATGDVTVTDGAILGGYGTIGGNTTVIGARLSPSTSPGTMTFNRNLTMGANAQITVELGDPSRPQCTNSRTNADSDCVVVRGDLTIDNTPGSGAKISVIPTSGISLPAGTFTLLTYGGTLTGGFDNSNIIYPSGYKGRIVTDTANKRILLTTEVDTDTVFWDGTGTTANDAVGGGSGTWNATATNWTTSTGDRNTAWSGSTKVPVFRGTAGTVTLADGYAASVGGLSFSGVSGYNITATGTGRLSLASNAVIQGDVGGQTATISAPITGGFGLEWAPEETDGGTLTLSGANTYTGTTKIRDGALVLQDSALGRSGDSTIRSGSAIEVPVNTTLTLQRTSASGLLAMPSHLSGAGDVVVDTAAATQAGALVLPSTVALTGTLQVNRGWFGTDGVAANWSANTADLTVSSGSVFSHRGNTITLGGLNGAGTVAASWSGQTTQVLRIGAGDKDGSFSGVIRGNNTGTDFGLDAGVTHLEKIGAGKQILGGANTYSGTTKVSNGTLEISGSGSTLSTAAIQVEAGATLLLSRTDIWGNAGSAGHQNLTLKGTLKSNSSYNTLTNPTLTKGAVLLGGGKDVSWGAFGFKGTVTSSDASSISIASGNNNRIHIGTGLSGGVTTFSVTDTLTVSAPLVDQTVTSALTKTGSGTLSLSGANAYTGATTVSAGTLRVDGTGTLGGGSYAGNISNSSALVFNTSNDQSLSGVLSGTGTLTQSGSGKLTLSGINTYTGATTIGGGTLVIGGSGSLGSGTYSNTITNNASLAFASAAAQTLSGVISGTGSLSKSASGTLTLSAANTYTGSTTVNGGTLELASAGTTPATGTFTVASGGTLTLSRSNAWGLHTADGHSKMTVAGTLKSNSTFNTFTHLTLNGGTLQAHGGESANFPAFALKGTLTSTGTSSISAGATTTHNGVMIGTNANGGQTEFNVTGSLNLAVPVVNNRDAGSNAVTSHLSKSGSGTLTLSAANTYTGTTTVSGGTLAIDGSGSLGSGTYSNTITNNASLAFASAAAQTLSGVISGTGSLSKSASGTLTLTAANTYTGTTTVSGGRLNINGNQSSASGAVTVQSGGTLGGTGTVGGATTVQSGGTLSPGMSPGTFTFSGNLTLQSGSTTRFELAQAGADGGSCNNWVPVGGNLELAGTLVVTATSGAAGCSSTFGEGSYTLFTYTGTATGSFATVTPPSGFTALVRIDTINKKVILDVAPNNGFVYWDGPNDIQTNAANGVINNGGGTWDTTSTNWTNSTGRINSVWTDNGPANFMGNWAGTVTTASGFTPKVTRINSGWNYLTIANNIALTGSPTVLTNIGACPFSVSFSGDVVTTSALSITNGSTFFTGNSPGFKPPSIGLSACDLVVEGNALVSGGNWSSAISSTASGQLRFNTTANHTLSGVLSGDMRLLKQNTGTLTLSGANTYTGSTTVSGGRLNINGNQSSASGAVTVQSGGTLGGTGTVGGATTVQSGGTLSPGMSPGTLTFSGNLTLQSGSTTRFDLAQAGTDGGSCNNWVPVGGNLELAGTLVVTATTGAAGCSSTFGEGSYTLFTYTGTATGSFATVTPPSGFTALVRIDTINKKVILDVAPNNGFVYWDGPNDTQANIANGVINNGGGTWDTTSTNWTNSTGRINSVWTDNGPANFMGNWAGTVTTASGFTPKVTRINAGANYLTIANSIELTGSPTVVTNTGGCPFPLTFSGDVVTTSALSITNGSTFFTGNSPGFKPPSIGLSACDLAVEGNALVSGGNWSSAISSTASGQLRFNTTANHTLSGVLSGDMRLLKQNTGTLTLSAANTYTGSTTVNGGTLELASAGTTPATGTFTVASGGTLTLSRSNAWGLHTADGHSKMTVAGTLKSNSTFNTFTHLTLNGGTLQAHGGESANYPAFALKGTLTSTGTSSISAGATTTHNGVMIGTNANGGQTEFNVTGSLNLAVPVVNNRDAGNNAVTSHLLKSGTGTLTLSAANTYTYTGTTTVSGGRLNINGNQSSANGAVTVQTGGTLGGTGTVGGATTVQSGGTLSPGMSPGTLAFSGNLTLQSGSTTHFELAQAGTEGGSCNDLLSVGGNLTLAGALKVTATASGTAGCSSTFGVGSYTLFTSPNSITGSFATVELPPNFTGLVRIDNNASPKRVYLEVSQSGSFTFWDTNAGNGQIDGGTGTWNASNTHWTHSAGWVHGAWPGGTATAVFGGTAGVVTMADGYSAPVGGITFNTTGYSLQRNISGTLALQQDATFDTPTGVINATIAVPITGNNRGLTWNPAGGGTLTLTHENTYTGATTVSKGTLELAGNLSNAQSSTPADSSFSVASGATLKLSRNNAWGTHGTAGHSNMTVAGTLASGNNFTTFTGLKLNSGTLQANGGESSTWPTFGLKGTLTSTGSSSISVGTASGLSGVMIGGNAAHQATTLDVTGSLGVAVPVMNNRNADASAEVDGDLVKNGGGTLTLSAVNSYSGTTTINAGTLTVDGSGSLGKGSYSQGITNNSALVFSTSANQTLAGVLSGTGTLSKSGTGTLTLSGANTYTGTTTVSGGTLKVSGSASLGSNSTYAANISNSGALDFNTSASQTLSGVISGTGTLMQSGSGTLTLSGTNTYTGATTVSAGTLVVSATQKSSSYAIASGAVLEYSMASGLGIGTTDAVSYTGTGTLRKTGAGTYSNGVAVATYALGAGALIDIQAGTFAASSFGNDRWSDNKSDVKVNTGATLDINSGDVYADKLTGGGSVLVGYAGGLGTLRVGVNNGSSTFDGTIGNFGSDPGQLIKAGTGTFTLSGANTYTGTTTISGGRLHINGNQSSANGAVTVQSGGTLGGTGTVGGATTVQDGGTLSAGTSPGTLSFSNGLTLAAGATSAFELAQAGAAGGSCNDLIQVTGNLTLGGTLKVDATTGVAGCSSAFGVGSYTLFTYTGTRTGDFSTVTSPSSNFSLRVRYDDNSSPKRVMLDVAVAGELTRWDATTANNAVIDGGTGTWSASNPSWTDGTGQVNGIWAGGTATAVFGGTAGTVTVEDGYNAPVGGISFNTTGYTIQRRGASGTGTIALQQNATFSTPSSGVNGAGIDASISTPISGNYSLSWKPTSTGTLTLSGVNTYTGSTTVSAGKLTIQATQASASYSIASGAVLEYDTAPSGLQQTSGAVTYSGAGTLRKSGTGVLGSGSSSATYALSAGAVIDIVAGTFSGSAFGNENWDHNKSDARVAAGATFDINSGTVRVDKLEGLGSVKVGYPGPLGSLTVGVNNGSATFHGVIGQFSDKGDLIKEGTGAFTLTNDNSYTGTTTVNGGTLEISKNGSTSNGKIPSTQTTVNSGATLKLSLSHIWGDALSAGHAALTLSGGTLYSNNSYNTFSASAFNGGKAVLDGGSSSTLGALGLKGTLNISGTTSISAANPQSAFSNGYNWIHIGSGLANGVSTFHAGALTDSMEISVPIHDNGVASGLSKTGAGLLTLSAANRYSGDTTIDGGTLKIDGVGSLGQGTYSPNIRLSAALVWNSTAAQTLGGTLSGNGTLSKSNTGTLTLSGTNTYTGTTTVEGGTLLVNGSTAPGSTVTVKSSAVGTATLSGTLGGTGTVGGATTVQSGGKLSPGTSPGTLTFGNGLTLQAGSTTTLELAQAGTAGGTCNDLINVTAGDLTLAGTLEVTAANGAAACNSQFGEGSYTLFNYAGVASGSFSAVSLPDPKYKGRVRIDTAGKRVMLEVSLNTSLTYWDESNTTTPTNTTGNANNGAVNGGTGTWDATTTNWTHSTGWLNGAWAGGTATAVFRGTAGTVTIANGYNASAGGLTFETHGYTLTRTGNGTLALTQDATFSSTAGSGSTATISTPITGTHYGVTWNATGGGAFVLNANNTYTGATKVSAGTLVINVTQNGTATPADKSFLVDTGATLQLSRTDSWGTHVTAGHSAMEVKGTVQSNSTFNTLSGLKLTGGTLQDNGGLDTLWPAFSLKGTVTVTGASAITRGTGNNHGVLIGDTTDGAVTDFSVANGATLNVTTPLLNNRNSMAANVQSALTKSGAGTLVLAAPNTYTGTTTVSAGTLQINSSQTSATGAVTVNSGATLQVAGTGVTVGGATTVQSGGNLRAAGSPSQPKFGSGLTLAAGSTTYLVMGAPSTSCAVGEPSDCMAVTGNLSLDATANTGSRVVIIALPGFAAGTYTLFSYTGTLSGTPDISNVVLPTGYVGTVVVDSAAKQVQLSVAVDTSLSYWDEATLTPANANNNAVNGGTGTWNATNSNWTRSSGNANGPWVGGTSTASFNGTAGTVTVADGHSPAIGGLSFGADGYTLNRANTGTLTLGKDAVFTTTTLANATINVPITGTYGIEWSPTQVTDTKGKLTLGAANTYTGKTTVSAGTLEYGLGLSPAGSDIVVGSSGTLLLSRTDIWGNAGTTGHTKLTVNGTLKSNNSYNTFTSPTLNNASLQLNGGKDGTWGTFGFKGTVTATGTSSIGLANPLGNTNFNWIHIHNAGTTFNVAANDDKLTIDVPIYNSSSGSPLIKTGTGTLTLSGANRYSGTTTLNAGTLILNGTHTSAASGAVTANANTTLAGKGSTPAAVIVKANASLAPGDGGVGTLTLGALTLEANSTTQFELGAPGTSGGTENDLLRVQPVSGVGTGNITLAGALNITPLSTFSPTGRYTLITYTGTRTGTFASNNLAAAGYQGVIQYDDANKQVLLLSVPQVNITTQSNGGVGTFGYALTGLSSNSLSQTTATSGVAVTGTPFNGTLGAAVSMVQSVPTGWPANPASVSCTDANGSTTGNGNGALGTVTGTRIDLPASVMKAGASITCAFVNTLNGLSGVVFNDGGAPSGGVNTGTPNDGIRNGNEAGLSGVAMTLDNCTGTTVYDSTTTDGGGAWRLYIPPAQTGQTVCVKAAVSASHVDTGANAAGTALPNATATTVGGVAYTYTRASAQVAFTAPATGTAVMDFGRVPVSALLTHSTLSARGGTYAVHGHRFTAGTGGSLSLSTLTPTISPTGVSGWSEALYLDPGCTGAYQPNATQVFPPAAPMAVLQGEVVCFVMRQFVPSQAGHGAVSSVPVQAHLSLTGASPTLSVTYTVTDVTTASNAAVQLFKQVRNLTTGGASAPWTTNNSAKKGDELEYQVTFTNASAAPVTEVVIQDSTTHWTTWKSAMATAVPSGTTCTMTTPAGTQTGCTTAMTGTGKGALQWSFTGTLLPSASGTVSFRVTVD